MEIFYDTLKNITVYIILVSVISNLLSGSTYKKYIRFFAGLVVIALILNPISKLINEGSDIFEKIKLYDLNTRFSEYEQNIKFYEEKDNEQYSMLCGDIINGLLIKHDLLLDDYEVEQDMSTGKPAYIYVRANMTEKLSVRDVIVDEEGNVSNKSLETRTENLKSDICESFGVASDVVDIYVGP